MPRFDRRFEGVQFLAKYVEKNTNMQVFAAGSAFSVAHLIENGFLTREQEKYFTDYLEAPTTDSDVAILFKNDEPDLTSNPVYLANQCVPQILKIVEIETYPFVCDIRQRKQGILAEFHNMDFLYIFEDGHSFIYDVCASVKKLNTPSLMPNTLLFDANKNIRFHNEEHKKMHHHFIACHEIIISELKATYEMKIKDVHDIRRRIAYAVKNALFYVKGNFFIAKESLEALLKIKQDTEFWENVTRVWNTLYFPHLNESIETALAQLQTSLEKEDIILNEQLNRFKKIYEINHDNYNALFQLISEINTHYKIMGKPLISDEEITAIKKIVFCPSQEASTIRDEIKFYYDSVLGFPEDLDKVLKEKYKKYYPKLEESKLARRKFEQKIQEKERAAQQKQMVVEPIINKPKVKAEKKPIKLSAVEKDKKNTQKDEIEINAFLNEMAAKKSEIQEVITILFYEGKPEGRINKNFLKAFPEAAVNSFLKKNDNFIIVWNSFLEKMEQYNPKTDDLTKDAFYIDAMMQAVTHLHQNEVFEIRSIPSQALIELNEIFLHAKIKNPAVANVRKSIIDYFIKKNKRELALLKKEKDKFPFPINNNEEADIHYVKQKMAMARKTAIDKQLNVKNYFKLIQQETLKCYQGKEREPILPERIIAAIMEDIHLESNPELLSMLIPYEFRAGLFSILSYKDPDAIPMLARNLIFHIDKFNLFEKPSSYIQQYYMVLHYLYGMNIYLLRCAEKESDLESKNNLQKAAMHGELVALDLHPILYLLGAIFTADKESLEKELSTKHMYPSEWHLGPTWKLPYIVNNVFRHHLCAVSDFFNPIFMFHKIMTPTPLNEKYLNNMTKILFGYGAFLLKLEGKYTFTFNVTLINEWILSAVFAATLNKDDAMLSQIKAFEKYFWDMYPHLSDIDIGIYNKLKQTKLLNKELQKIVLFTAIVAVYDLMEQCDAENIDLFNDLIPMPEIACSASVKVAVALTENIKINDSKQEGVKHMFTISFNPQLMNQGSSSSLTKSKREGFSNGPI